MQYPFENAHWISCPDCPADTAPVFRAEFDCSAGADAVLYLSGVGFEAVSLNGQELDDELLSPAFSRYDKTVYYRELSLKPYVREGGNCLEITLGNGWFNQQQEDAWQFEHAIWKASPRLVCAVYCGGKCLLASGSDWLCAPSGTVFNSLRCGETCDARIEELNWHAARVMPPPGGRLRRQTIDPIRVRRTYAPICTVPFAPPTIYDFGINLSGNVEICVEGAKGSRVDIFYSELITINGRVSRELIAAHVHSQRFQQDTYILKGEGQETWHSKFGYNGFRYACVRTTGDCRLLSVHARQFHTDLRDAGGIETCDESIRRIHSAIRQSSLTNFYHMPTDCPHREKNGWTGDAWLSAEQMLFNFDMRRAYAKWLDDILDSQRESGQIPGIVPTSAWGYSWGSGVTWDAALFEIPWQMYMFYGDTTILLHCAPAMRRYLEYLTDVLDDGIPAIGLGDWVAPANIEVIPDGALRAAIAVYVGRLAGNIGEVIGDQALSEAGQKVARICGAAFRREYDSLKGCHCQLYYALRLLLGLTDDMRADQDGLLESVHLADGHVLGGMFSASFVPEALRCCGAVDAAWKMVSAKGFPGWDDLARKCAGTLGENWYGGSSMNHHLFSSVGAWYYKALAGIQIEEPGFKKVLITPYIPEDLPSFRAWHETPLGRLAVAWDEKALKIEVPGGMKAELELNRERRILHAGRNTVERKPA